MVGVALTASVDTLVEWLRTIIRFLVVTQLSLSSDLQAGPES
jgi:hypothetical protein